MAKGGWPPVGPLGFHSTSFFLSLLALEDNEWTASRVRYRKGSVDFSWTTRKSKTKTRPRTTLECLRSLLVFRHRHQCDCYVSIAPPSPVETLVLFSFPLHWNPSCHRHHPCGWLSSWKGCHLRYPYTYFHSMDIENEYPAPLSGTRYFVGFLFVRLPREAKEEDTRCRVKAMRCALDNVEDGVLLARLEVLV